MKHIHFIALVLLVSCGARSPLKFEAPLQDEVVGNFSNLNTTILETKCLKCHENFRIEENMLKYIEGNDPDHSKLFQVVKDGSMPKKDKPLTTLELEMVRNYIRGVEVIRNVSFDELRKEVLAPKCISCHKSAGDEEKMKTRWVNVKSPFESKLYNATKDGRMPKDAPHLTPAEMKFIKGYLRSF